MSQFSLHAKLKAVEREIALRERVYPKQVAGRRMSSAEMTFQINIFREIAEDYRATIEREQHVD